jgi:23S rRNA A2030 N6-methylase RlmJ
MWCGRSTPNGNLTLYPGSPYLASKLLREQDRLRLFEMHPTDVDLLGKTFPDAGKQGHRHPWRRLCRPQGAAAAAAAPRRWC